MSDIIHLLPDSVANQIAAGEVIQRPSSVIKELVENAVDAGASRIDVLVEDAGKTLIQVVDDGKGMSETDARLAFERHATSKITHASDLFALKTMGFRGEALASIAAVAQVELRTKTPSESLGTCVLIAGSEVQKQEPVSCPQGSNFMVKNLFFNVPARRKFLKSNQTELSNILQEFERIALVHEDIAFTLTHNGTVVLNLPKSTLRQRIAAVFGKKCNEQLLSVGVDTSMIRVNGFVGKPESARKKGLHQYFFINGRYMRHPYFHKAVMEAYDRLIGEGEQVSYFIYLETDPSTIDVNIHPTKTEIKFENEMAIWQILVASVKEGLGRFNAVPSIDFDMEGVPEIPAFDTTTHKPVQEPTVDIDVNFNPFHTTSTRAQRKALPDWDRLYAAAEGGGSAANEMASLLQDDEWLQEKPDEEGVLMGSRMNEQVDTSALHYQYKGKYVLTTVKSGLMLIDQHRAHVRVLYEKYRKQMEGEKGLSQGLLFPDILQLPLSESVILEHLLDDMQSLGFELASLGGGSFSINAIPSGTEGLNPVELVSNIVYASIEKGQGVEGDAQHYIALSLAKSAAIVYGQVLSQEEMQSLIEQLFALRESSYSPDGKMIIAMLEQADIDRLFA